MHYEDMVIRSRWWIKQRFRDLWINYSSPSATCGSTQYYCGTTYTCKYRRSYVQAYKEELDQLSCDSATQKQTTPCKWSFCNTPGLGYLWPTTGTNAVTITWCASTISYNVYNFNLTLTITTKDTEYIPVILTCDEPSPRLPTGALTLFWVPAYSVFSKL